ncbi:MULTISPECIES: terminase family protein [Brevundimonas]|nr:MULTISPECIES: terminase family protein [Brevundimonas]EDX80075.1 conserved hypothetical protein [Brevundimonas sp. BAL3]
MGKPSKLSDEEWEALFDRDARGERRSDLAREHGVSVSTLCWQAKKRGRMKGQAPDAVDHRRRPAEGWPADHVFPQSRSGMTPARWRELLARRNAGETSAVLEAEYGVTTGAIAWAAKRYGLRKMDTPGAVYQPRGPAAGAYNYGRGEPALTIEIDWSDPVGTVRELHADVLKRLSDGDEPEAARLWRWSQRTRVMAGVGAADLRALWKKHATSPGGYRPSGYLSPQTPGLLQGGDGGGQGGGGLVLRPAQKPPEGAWSTWLFLGGRGAGKTLAGASWIADMAERLGAGGRLALIGPTLHDVREVMIAGPSGVMSLPRWTGVGGDGAVEWRGPEYQPSRRRLVFPNGAEAFVFSAEDPDSLRGPQFAAAWADEFCAWRNGGETLALLRMGLRLRLPNPDSPAVDADAAQNGGVGAKVARLREPSDSPRLVVTTTPRPTRALKALRAEASCALTHATTRDNGDHLAPGFLEGLERLYGGTRRAAQELEGQVVEPEGGLFTAEMMAAARGEAPVSVEARPVYERVVVGLDPTCSRGGDACGIVAVGRRGETAWVLADRSMRGLSPQKWAERAMETARLFGARCIVGEVNQGGDMVEAVLKAAGCGADGENIGFTAVRASRGKAARAEPVAALYEQGRVRHAGVFAALEEELMELGAEEEGQAAGSGEGHWDRADALVWAVTDLMLDGRGAGPRVRAL